MLRTYILVRAVWKKPDNVVKTTVETGLGHLGHIIKYEGLTWIVQLEYYDLSVRFESI